MFKLLLTAVLLTFTHGAAAKSVTFDERRTVRIVGAIDTSAIPKYAERIYGLIGEKKPIYLLINSTGGMVIPGTSVIDAIEAAKASGSEVHCMVGSLAASMAFQIYVHCSHRYAFTHSKLLYHPMSIKVAGRVSELATLLSYLAQMERSMKAKLLKELKISKSLFEAHYAAETMWEARHIQALSPHFLVLVKEIKGIKDVFNFTEGRGRYNIPSRKQGVRYDNKR